MSDFKVIKSSQIKKLRDSIKSLQEGKCRICGCELTSKSKSALDHQHLTKAEELGVNGGGLIRGVLCGNCNILEGKIWNGIKRYGFAKNHPVEDRVAFLESLIHYYKDNYQQVERVLHPSENRAEKITKAQYNKLKKTYEKIKPDYEFPKYPTKGKITKEIQKILNEVEFLKSLDDFKSDK